MSTLDQLTKLGQSVWLDYIDHDLVVSDELTRLIGEGLRGMTSNPTIFQKAIAKSSAYDDVIRKSRAPASDVLEEIMVDEVRAACDRFRGVYEATSREDGYVSIEVSPFEARNTRQSIEEAHRLWDRIARPNLMVKIPGTREGLPAIHACLVSGINVNVTLLFSVARYRQVVDAFVTALEERLSRGAPIDHLASVASFFVSRIDTKVDHALDAIPNAITGAAGALRGQIAIANAKLAYEEYQRFVDGGEFRHLAAMGARPQRLLWASTSTKDPRYPDTYYADALVGAETIDTMTPETIRAYQDHGHPELRLTQGTDLAHRQLVELKALAIDLPHITSVLEEDGVRSFAASYAQAAKAVEEKRRRLDAA